MAQTASERTEWAKRILHPLAIFGLVASIYVSGLLDFLDFELTDLRFRTVTRPATADLIVVEIDTPSLKELDVWPWPRSHHARLIDILVGVGARQVAFDVDFSSRSSDGEDALLAAALAAAEGRVILPAFPEDAPLPGQTAATTIPLPVFSRHSRLAAVEVAMESDGRVRRAFAWGHGGRTLPSLSSILAGSEGPAEESFFIDFGIAPGSIPRISFADILSGRFDPRDVAGRNVLVGATAMELGDQIPVPVFGVLPGSIVQALAYQSLIQDRALSWIGSLPTLIATALLIILLFPAFQRLSWPKGLAAFTAVCAALMLAAMAAQSYFAAILSLAPMLLAAALCYAWAVAGRLNQQDLRIMTQGLELRRKDAYLARVVENSFDAILTVDDVDTVTSFNPAAARIFGCDAAVVLGKPLESVMPDSVCEATQAGFATSLRDCGGPYEVSGTAWSGERITVQAVVSRMEFNREHLRIVILRDVTELKKKEVALRDALVEAQLADRCKSEFLANMSHELRTPLNAIIGFTDIMIQEIGGPIQPSNYKDYVVETNGAGQQLLNIVEDVLNLSKINAGVYKLAEEEVDIAAVIQNCVETYDAKAKEAEVVFSTDLTEQAVSFFGDERAVQQILVNLLSNAVKFTPAGGRVVLSSEITECGGLRFSVADTGIGIEREAISSILSDFGQVEEAYARNYNGIGLGLPLALRLAELHGGTLTLDSAPDRGTTATATFPSARVSWQEAKLRTFGR